MSGGARSSGASIVSGLPETQNWELLRRFTDRVFKSAIQIPDLRLERGMSGTRVISAFGPSCPEVTIFDSLANVASR